jgi:hypothetical protein
MRQKVDVIVQLRSVQHSAGRLINLATVEPAQIGLRAACWMASTSPSRSSSSLSGSPAMPMRARSPM